MEILEFLRGDAQIATPILLLGTVILGFIKLIMSKKGNNLWHNINRTLTLYAAKNDSETIIDDLTGELNDGVKDIEKKVLTEIQSNQAQNAVLGEMLSIIVDNSTLPVETKERFNVLKAKLNFNSESETINNLLAEKEKVYEELEYYKTLIAQKEEQVPQEAEKKSTVVVN